MPKAQETQPTLGPVFTALAALAGIGLLLTFSVIWFHQGNPALGGAAGTAAIGLVAWAVRHLLNAAVRPPVDDGERPSADEKPAPAEVP